EAGRSRRWRAGGAAPPEYASRRRPRPSRRMRAMRIVAVVLACVVTCGAGCGGSTPAPAQQPVEFLAVLFGHLYRGEHGQAWGSLYPAHQDVVPRGEYVACEENAPPFAGTLERVELLTSKEEE